MKNSGNSLWGATRGSTKENGPTCSGQANGEFNQTPAGPFAVICLRTNCENGRTLNKTSHKKNQTFSLGTDMRYSTKKGMKMLSGITKMRFAVTIGWIAMPTVFSRVLSDSVENHFEYEAYLRPISLRQLRISQR